MSLSTITISNQADLFVSVVLLCVSNIDKTTYKTYKLPPGAQTVSSKGNLKLTPTCTAPTPWWALLLWGSQASVGDNPDFYTVVDPATQSFEDQSTWQPPFTTNISMGGSTDLYAGISNPPPTIPPFDPLPPFRKHWWILLLVLLLLVAGGVVVFTLVRRRRRMGK